MKGTIPGEFWSSNKLDIIAGVFMVIWSITRVLVVFVLQSDKISASGSTTHLPTLLGAFGVFAGLWMSADLKKGYISTAILGALYGLIMLVNPLPGNMLFAAPNLLLLIYSVFRLCNPNTERPKHG